jgi:hypothetical protein
MSDPIIPEVRRGRRRRGLVAQPLSAAPPRTTRKQEPTWLRNIPGWPSHGKFSLAGKEAVALEYRSAVTVSTDLIQGLHLVDGSSAPRDGRRLQAMAYDTLYSVRMMLQSVTPAGPVPCFLVAWAALREQGCKLPPSAPSARRTLKRIVARIRREQATAPAVKPKHAGVTCRRYPCIAISEHCEASFRARSGEHDRAGY